MRVASCAIFYLPCKAAEIGDNHRIEIVTCHRILPKSANNGYVSIKTFRDREIRRWRPMNGETERNQEGKLNTFGVHFASINVRASNLMSHDSRRFKESDREAAIGKYRRVAP